jgi:hypothetical protein
MQDKLQKFKLQKLNLEGESYSDLAANLADAFQKNIIDLNNDHLKSKKNIRALLIKRFADEFNIKETLNQEIGLPKIKKIIEQEKEKFLYEAIKPDQRSNYFTDNQLNDQDLKHKLFQKDYTTYNNFIRSNFNFNNFNKYNKYPYSFDFTLFAREAITSETRLMAAWFLNIQSNANNNIYKSNPGYYLQFIQTIVEVTNEKNQSFKEKLLLIWEHCKHFREFFLSLWKTLLLLVNFKLAEASDHLGNYYNSYKKTTLDYLNVIDESEIFKKLLNAELKKQKTVNHDYNFLLNLKKPDNSYYFKDSQEINDIKNANQKEKWLYYGKKAGALILFVFSLSLPNIFSIIQPIFIIIAMIGVIYTNCFMKCKSFEQALLNHYDQNKKALAVS